MLLAACGDDSNSGTGEPGDIELTLDDESSVLSFVGPVSGYLRPDYEQRLVFALTDFQGAGIADPPDSLDFQLYYEGTGGEARHEPIGDPVSAGIRSDGIPRPYYPVRFTPTETGIYSAETTVGSPVNFQVESADTVPLVQIGGEMVSVPTATFDDPLDMETVCTLSPEPCPFHTESLDTVLADGRPVAFLIATPQFCQVDICGPVLDLLIDAQDAYPDVTFIHSEVFTDATVGGDIAEWTPAPPLDAYGLTFEPSLFVGDAAGMCTDRLDLAYDATELNESLAKA